MRCNQCGGQYISKHGDLELQDDYIGPFTVESVEYLECDGCRELAYSPETIRAIEKNRDLALDAKLRAFPLRDFISPTTTAAILGISRQALHKHRRIRRGFIFQTKFDDKKAYLKKSVERFKKTGDGRFPLVKPESESKYTSKKEMTVIVLTQGKDCSFSGSSHFSKGLGQAIMRGRISYARQ